MSESEREIAARLHGNNNHRPIAQELLEEGYGLEGTLTELERQTKEKLTAAKLYTAGELVDDFPKLDEPVIEGLLRQGETMNLVSASKIGKSWLLLSLLLSVVTGRTWLGRFQCHQGLALLVDNELKPSVLASRIKAVAQAMAISPAEYRDALYVWPVRGVLPDVFGIGKFLATLQEPFTIVAVDAKYRATPPGTDENSNASETEIYNEIDKWPSAKVLVHHSSKGLQGEKRTVDVGSGAGAQSRACDSHLILREHQDDDAAVLDAAVRSFAPVESLGVRWQFPVWVPDDALDVSRLKGRNEKQAQQDQEADNAVIGACPTWQTRSEIRQATGYGVARLDRCIARLLAAKLLETEKRDRPRNPGIEVFRKSIHAR
jgi:AAA domain